MTKQTEIAQSLDALVNPLQDSLEKIDTALAAMDGAQLFDALGFVRKYGDLCDEPHSILARLCTFFGATPRSTVLVPFG